MSPLTQSGYEWRYLFKGGREDGEGIYRIGSGEWDHLTAGELTPDAEAYWGTHLAIKPISLSKYDTFIIKAVPIAIGAVVGLATGGLGFAGAGILAGFTGGLSGGFIDAYGSGESMGSSIGSGVIGGAIGGISGWAGGPLAGRLAGGVGSQLGRVAISGALDGAAGGFASGMVAGYEEGGFSGALVGGLQGALYGAGVGAVTAGALHGRGAIAARVPSIGYVKSYIQGGWQSLSLPRQSISLGSAFGSAEDAFETLARAHRYGKLAAKETALIRRGARYDVGEYATLRGVAESELDAHHVGQKVLMQRFIPGYDLTTAPSILVPRVGHTIRDLELGIVSRSTSGFTNVRQVMARDIRELRRVYSDIPNAQIKSLIKMNKEKYPAFLTRSVP